MQLIYVARPGFGPGLHDPVPRHTGVRRGEVEAIAVAEVLPDPPLRDETDAAAFGPDEGLDDLCKALRARLAGELHERRFTASPRSPPEPGRRADGIPCPAAARAPQRARPAQRFLSPLPAALSAEAHLLATLPPDGRPPDMLGMARVMKLMALATERAGAERAAVA